MVDKKIPEFVTHLREKHESGFLGFWVKQYRISYLIVLALIVLGVGALFSIPKESSPSIKFGIVNIVTVFPGASPVDIDSLITDKIYKEIKDINGAKKITSSSSLGVSSVTAELDPSTDVTEYINEVRNNIGRVALPKDAKNPNVVEIKAQSDLVFSVTLTSADGSISKEKLRLLGADLRDKIATLSQVKKAEYGSELKYDVRVVIEKEKLSGLGITISDVANTIRAYHQDAPIGNYGVGEKNYDFRLEGKFENTKEILSVPLVLANGKTIQVGDIAQLERKYENTSIERIGFFQKPAQDAVSITVEKTESTGIFAASTAVKKIVDDILQTPSFQGVKVAYANDQADAIRDDYAELAREALITLVLVLTVMWLFIGFRDALFATFTLPLAFLVTFMLLNGFGYSLNFLTNFSLIISFGIAVDTIAVIVQAASAKIRVGYEPRTAIMLALREYGVPVISGVMTTIVAFIPMMVLPGILGKFLAYIPITIFGVLASGLVLALTVNSALYLAFIKRKNTYVHDDTAVEYATDEEKKLLEYERIGKTEITDGARPLRIRMIHGATQWYKSQLRKFLSSKTLRLWSIWGPVLILILSFVPIFGGKSLAGHVGFDLFPGSDNGFVQYEVK